MGRITTVGLGANGEMYLGSGPPEGGEESLESSGGFAVYAPGASGNDEPLGYLGKNAGLAYSMVLEHPWYQL
jgi:hypothetical protein